MLILQFIEFILFAFIAFYLPGKLIIEKFKINLPFLERIVILPVIGIFFFAAISLILRLLMLPFYTMYLFIIPLAFWNAKRINFYKWKSYKFHFSHLILIVVLLLGTILLSWPNYFSGITTSEGIVFSSFHDPAFHLSVIGELKHHFPPEHPTFANEFLKNYHYFPDLVIAGVDSMIKVDINNLYFRIIPFFVSLYFGLSVYVVANLLTNKYWVKCLAVFLTYFTGSFSYFIPIFVKGTSWNDGAFLLDQPYSVTLNPHNIFGFIIFLSGILFILKYDKVKNIYYLYLVGLIFAFAFTFKTYVSILGMSSLIFVSIYLWIIKKDFNGFRVFFTSSIIFIASYFLLINNARNGIYFLPGWTLDRMVSDPVRLYLPNDSLVKQVYFENNNYLRIIQIYCKEFLLYFFGNLGTRTLGFIFLVFSFKSLRNISTGFIFILIFTLASLLIPVLFNQGGTPYNIIQFGSYALIVTSIFSAIAVKYLFDRSLFKKNKFIFWSLVFLFILMSIPGSLMNLVGGFHPEKFVVPMEELNILNYLKNVTSKNSVILMLPERNDYSPAYVSAISERRVFLGDTVQVELTNLNYIRRFDELMSTINGTNPLVEKFLTENKISYLYLTTNKYNEIKDTIFISKFKLIIKNERAFLFKFN